MEFIKEAYRIHAHDGKGKILAEIEFPEVSPGVLTELKFFLP